MADEPTIEQLIAEAQGCFVQIDEFELPRLEKAIRDIRKLTDAGLEILSDLANQQRLARQGEQ